MRRSTSSGLRLAIAGFAAGALVTLDGAIPASSAIRLKKTESVDLTAPLAQAAQYCRRLEASVLDFVCREEVVETVDPSRDGKRRLAAEHDWNWMQGRAGVTTYSFVRKVKNTSIYDYQCIRKVGVLKETRTLIKLNGKPLDEHL